MENTTEKTEKKIAKDIEKIEEKVEDNKINQKQADKEIEEEVEQEIEKTNKEAQKQKKNKKTEAIVNARNLPISTKHSIAICNLIRNKDIDTAISLLELAEKKKIAVPMKGEIPHRKGIMSGRYPVTAIGHFIKSLKSLKSNAIANELELEKYIIFCKADVASRPYRRFGRGRFKRTHVTLKLIQSKKNKTGDKE